MKKLLLIATVVWLGSEGIALASDCACWKLDGVYTRYLTSRNSCAVEERPGETCSTVPKGAATTEQRLISIGMPRATPPVPPTVPEKYRKVVSGLVVEMGTAEKSAVDAAIALEEARRQEFNGEIAANEICTQADLSAINTYFQNMASRITAVIALLPDGANKDAHIKTATELGTTMRKMARFICARAKLQP